MEIKLKVPEKYADRFKDLESIEACFRQNNARFKEFINIAVAKEKGIEEVGKELMDAFLSSSEKVNHSINVINNTLSDVNKNVNDIANAADQILKKMDKSKILSFVNTGLNAANLCATAAGFAVMSEHLDEISKELNTLSKDVGDILEHQENLDQKNVEKLINNYGNILNKESVGREISLDERYELVDDMFLTIKFLLKCFMEDVGHRQVYYDALSALLPMYIVSICKFDREHYFAYGKLHMHHDKYVSILNEFSSLDFFKEIQDYAFLNKDLCGRESFDNAFVYIAKIEEQKVAINDNLLIIKHFKSEDEYNKFRQLQDWTIFNEIKNNAEEVAQVLQENLELATA